MATRGQQGVLVAMPGRSSAEALNQFSALAAPPLGAAATAATLVASTFDLVIHVVSGPDASARIIEVSEPRAAGNEVAVDVSLSLYNEGSKRDPAGGRLQGRGISARLAAPWRPRAAPCRRRWSASNGLTRRKAASPRDTAFFDRFRAAVARLPAG